MRIIITSTRFDMIADGEPIVHKTFHSYTVRAKQGFAQNSRTNGNHAKSAGASLRRYNEASLIQVHNVCALLSEINELFNGQCD